MKSNPTFCSCLECHKVFSMKGFNSHYENSHVEHSKYNTKISEKTEKRKENYAKSPSLCNHCNTALSYEQRNYKYCSHSCAANSTNIGKVVAEETKRKIRETLLSKQKSKKQPKPKKPTVEIVGEFSKLFLCHCRSCSQKFCSQTVKLYCRACSEQVQQKRHSYRFEFNVYNYPDLFDLELLSTVGFYSPGGKSGKWNPNGLSRDHKVSISEAIKNQHDPYFIKHPMNCELIPHSENNRKKGKCSISYEELQKLVIEYDKLVGSQGNDPLV